MASALEVRSIMDAWGTRGIDKARSTAEDLLRRNGDDVEAAIALGSLSAANSQIDMFKAREKRSSNVTKIFDNLVEDFDLDTIFDLQTAGPEGFDLGAVFADAGQRLDNGESVDNITDDLFERFQTMPGFQTPVSASGTEQRAGTSEAFGQTPAGGATDTAPSPFLTQETMKQIRFREEQFGAAQVTGNTVQYDTGAVDIINPNGGLIAILGVGGAPVQDLQVDEEGLPTVETLMQGGLTRQQAEDSLKRIVLRRQNVTASAIDDILGASGSGSSGSGGTGGTGLSASQAAQLGLSKDIFKEDIRQFDLTFGENARQFDVASAEDERSNRANEGISGFRAQTDLGLGLGDLTLSEADLRRQILSNPSDALARIFAQSNELSPFGRFTAADQLNYMGAGLNAALNFAPGGSQAVYNGGPTVGGGGGGGFPSSAARQTLPQAPVAPSGTPSTGGNVIPTAGAAAPAGAPAAAIPSFQPTEAPIIPRIGGLVEEEILAGAAPQGTSADSVQARQFLRGLTDEEMGGTPLPIPQAPAPGRGLADFDDEEFGFAQGGFTNLSRFEVGENPAGGGSGFEEIILNPTGAPIGVVPSKEARRKKGGKLRGRGKRGKNGMVGFATGTFGGGDPAAQFANREPVTQQGLIDLARQGSSGRLRDVQGGRAPNLQQFGVPQQRLAHQAADRRAVQRRAYGPQPVPRARHGDPAGVHATGHRVCTEQAL